MELQIISTQTIKPSNPTPHNLRNFKLSFLDQMTPSIYFPITLFYNTKFETEKISDIHNQLKKSLSETLNLYYPLAGRTRNSFSIDCNDEGVTYIEAMSNFTLAQFLNKPDLHVLNKFLPCNTGIMEYGSNQIQLSIQVSILGCGGLVIGACMFHRAGDIATLTSFLKTWATFAAETRDKEGLLDVTLGSSIFPGLSSLPDEFTTNQMKYFFQGSRNSQTRRFVFDATAIAALREKATSESVPKPSRVEALTGFISKRIMEGSKALNETPRSMMISHAVNIRRRFDPPLPENAFGNFTWISAAFYDYSKDNEMELAQYVEILREALQAINDESLRELQGKSSIQMVNETMEIVQKNCDLKHYKFTSWCNMGIYDLDFGWGRPAWVAHMGDPINDQSKHHLLFMEGKNDGEIELWMLLSDEEIAMLDNDAEFTAYATPNPSISLKV